VTRGFALVLVASVLAPTAVRAVEPAKTTLAIKGMTCGGCVASVKLQLKRAAGVLKYEVSYEAAEAVVTFDPAKTTPEKIAEAVSKTGFTISVKKPAPGADAGVR
jgi:copper chaperone CopZ